MVEAARIAEAAGPDLLDLNFGCPVKRVAGKGAGSGMLRCPALMLEIVREIVKAVKIPVTVKTRLGWDHDSRIIVELAEALQETPLFGNSRAQGTPHEAGSPQTASLPEPDTLANQNAPTGRPTPDAQAIDQQILRAAITNGAIELLPESLSTLAIIPLQMRLVYQIGQQYGYPLDKGHIRDFLATLGVGVTSQYLEQAGRKLLGSLLGKKLGKGMLGGLGRQAVSSGMSFASTYALGHVAREYYAGGRTLSTQMLKDAYQRMLGDGRALQSQYLPRIEAESRQLDAAKVMALVRGQG